MTLDGDHIRALISEVADELDATDGNVHTIIVDAFYEAFPAAPHDEHLDNFIVEELGKGGYDISPS
jgi:hypothetical protein